MYVTIKQLSSPIWMKFVTQIVKNPNTFYTETQCVRDDNAFEKASDCILNTE